MNTNPADIDLIERYLHGQLTQAEAADFETRLGEDHEFARKLRLRKNFPSLFKAEGHDEIAMAVTDTPEVRVKKKKVHFLKARHIIWGIIVLVTGVLIYFLAVRLGQSVSRPADQAHTPVKTVEQVQTKVKTTEQVHPPLKTADQVQANMKAAEQMQTPLKTPEPLQTKVRSAEQLQVPVQAAEPIQTPIKAEPTAPKTELTEKAIPRETAIKIHKPIELESPADNLVVKRGEEILFTWKQATDSFTNFFIISEAGNKLAWWRGIRPGIRECKVPAIKFKPGRFYWYVGNKEFKRTLIVKE
jgi:anti-sigma factor RsiW